MSCELSVLIVCFHDDEVLFPCLSSILDRPDELAFEVVVVDNASSPATARRLASEYPAVRLVPCEYNSGYAGGNNLAFAHARGRYVLFLNPDTIVQPGALRTMVQRADALPGLGALGPKILNPDGSLQRSLFRSPRLSDFLDSFVLSRVPGFARLFGYLGYKDDDYQDERPVDAVTGCALLARRSLLQEIGAFDEEYFIYFEEADLCERIRRSGRKVYYTPEASIVHLGGATTSRDEVWYRIQAERSRRRFFKKHRSTGAVAALAPLVLCSSMLRFLYATVAVIATAGLSPRIRRKPLNEIAVLGWQLGLIEHGVKPS
jgi:N-acetylglucosaminyl-diphospho-decaprenol L-rhamnosyltransferase